MSSSLDIYPFHDSDGVIRFGVQIVIFIIGVIVAQKLIITPALRLYNERTRRTTGNVELAKQRIDYANKIEEEYFAHLKEGTTAAQVLRQQNVELSQNMANTLIAENQKQAAAHISSLKAKLAEEMHQTKATLGAQVESIVTEIYKKIGVGILLTLLCASILYTKNILAAEEPLIYSFWYSIFWPYFQFLCFAVAIVYLAKKPLTNALEKQRDELRARLSEAKEAVTLAERKVTEYESKLSTLQQEIANIKSQSLASAKLEGEKILADAKKLSEALLQEAERNSRELIIRNREELRHDIFKMALEEVEKRLTPEKLSTLDAKLKTKAIQVVSRL